MSWFSLKTNGARGYQRSEPAVDPIALQGEPEGITLRGKPRGIIKLNKNIMMLGGAVLIVAAVVAVFTFNNTSGAAVSAARSAIAGQMGDRPVAFKRQDQWYSKKPDIDAGINATASPPVNGSGGDAGTSNRSPVSGPAAEAERPGTNGAGPVPAGVPDLTGQAVSVAQAATAPKTSVPLLPGLRPMGGVPAGPVAAAPQGQGIGAARDAALKASLTAAGFDGREMASSGLTSPFGNTVAPFTGSRLASLDGMARRSATGSTMDVSAGPIGTPTNPGALATANGQGQSASYLGSTESGVGGPSRTPAKSPYSVVAGTVIPAIMISGINTDLPGQVIAQVRENVFDTATGRFLLIPQGARLIGSYDSRIAYGQGRVLIAWQRIIFPDASSVDLKGMPGADSAGFAGFEDLTYNHYGRIFGAAILMSGITAGVELSQRQQQNSNGYPSTSETVAGALGQQLGQTGMTMTQKNLNVQPTIVVRPGFEFNVMVTGDLSLPPNSR